MGSKISIPPSWSTANANREITLLANEQGLYRIILPGKNSLSPVQYPPPNSLALKTLTSAARQLNRYFQGQPVSFELDIILTGTSFQKKVWALIKKIPYGKTSSYSEIAQQLGNRNKARAVGNAANKNPLPLIIPCHRVIGADNHLTGYAGGVTLKQALLRLEKNACDN